jgi:hypothetical protein
MIRSAFQVVGEHRQLDRLGNDGQGGAGNGISRRATMQA